MLDIFSIRGHDETLMELLDHLYNSVMQLPTTYREWIRAMRRVGDDFTRPTMRRILRTPEVMKEILEFEGQKEAGVRNQEGIDRAECEESTTKATAC
jgi:hypothetical protein